jgi:hypothetical protein
MEAAFAARNAVGALDEAKEAIAIVIDKGANVELIEQIGAAVDAVNREFDVAAAMIEGSNA